MLNAIRAGAVYFLIIFAVGFVLGTVRVLLLTPALGETTAVITELPLILTASWLACRYVIRKLDVAATLSSRAVMGASAFVLLLAAETLLGIYGFGRAPHDLLAQYVTLAGGIGLGGQILFAGFPAARLCFEDGR